MTKPNNTSKDAHLLTEDTLKQMSQTRDFSKMSRKEVVKIHPEWDCFFRSDYPSQRLSAVIYTWLKIFLFLPLLPFKMFFFIFFGCLGYVTGFLAHIGVPYPDPDDMSQSWCKTYPYWRFKLLDFNRLTSRIQMFFFSFYQYKTKGEENLREYVDNHGAGLIVSNHTSYLDILLLMSIILPSFVSKHTVKTIPIFGIMATLFRTIYVDRSGTKASNTAEQIIKRSQPEIRRKMPPLVLFPEGTTSNGENILQFKTGGFISGEPVLPVAIHYNCKNFSLTWESAPFGWHILRMASQFVNRAEITYLPIYYPSTEEKADPQLYARNVQLAIAKELGVPALNFGSAYHDKLTFLASVRQDTKKRD